MSIKSIHLELKAANYHGETANFLVGQSVTHVTDEGQLCRATITYIKPGSRKVLLELDFEDGDEGSETTDTCY